MVFVKHVPQRVTKGNRRVKEALEVYRASYKAGQGTKHEYVARWSLPYGSLPTEPPTALSERLTDSEREQLSVWWSEFRDKREETKAVKERSNAIASASYTTSQLKRIQPEDLSEEERANLGTVVVELNEQAKRLLGKKRTTRKKPATVAKPKPAVESKPKPTVAKKSKPVAKRPPLPAGFAPPKKANPTLARVSNVLNISGGEA